MNVRKIIEEIERSTHEEVADHYGDNRQEWYMNEKGDTIAIYHKRTSTIEIVYNFD